MTDEAPVSTQDLKLLADDYLQQQIVTHCEECGADLQHGDTHAGTCTYAGVKDIARRVATLEAQSERPAVTDEPILWIAEYGIEGSRMYRGFKSKGAADSRACSHFEDGSNVYPVYTHPPDLTSTDSPGRPVTDEPMTEENQIPVGLIDEIAIVLASVDLPAAAVATLERCSAALTPTDSPTHGFIPVSEELPPRHTHVWCLNRDGYQFEGCICYGLHEPFFTYPRGDGSASNTLPAWIDVVAWKPLDDTSEFRAALTPTDSSEPKWWCPSCEHLVDRGWDGLGECEDCGGKPVPLQPTDKR